MGIVHPIDLSEAPPAAVARLAEKVRERVALTRATGHLLPPVLLPQTDRAGELDARPVPHRRARPGAPPAPHRET